MLIFSAIKLLFSSKKRYNYALIKLLGFIPGNLNLYELAFVHRSASLVLSNGSNVNNERLEFLGDAILDAVIAEFLFLSYPKKDEGFLSKMRSKIVKRKQLNSLAISFGIDRWVVAHAINQNGGKHICGNAFEALIGAIYLDKGAHLEVPYTTAFLPANITISVWIKPIELYENNYIVSQNFWQGYKLQTQGGGKPFFTYKKVDGGIIDADNETDNSVKISVWNHIVVSVNGTTKEEKIYVNGTLTKTWTLATKGIGPLVQTLTAPAAQPFIIGCAATDSEIATDTAVGWMDWTTAANFGYFRGAIDELKIYNIALADGQVSKLYNDEKP